MSEYDALAIVDPLAEFLADVEHAANLGRGDPAGSELAFTAAERNALLYELLWRRQAAAEGRSGVLRPLTSSRKLR